ncbi:hypothetical protein [Amycolatopsis sp. NPDC059021]|uniref:hypothetical protein n=1 Tax=Amycolatopsis sp. NPDC059021 TaxID=3346704 RepID=UPI00366B0ACE
MGKVAFTEFITVRRYARSLARLPEADRAARLAALAQFAEFVGRTPDEMIEEVFDERTRRYRRQGFYSDKAREFAALDGPPAIRIARGVIVRAFFAANGRRLLPEYAEWSRPL